MSRDSEGWSEEWLANRLAKGKTAPFPQVKSAPEFSAAVKVEKPSKYRNKKVITDEGTFDSKKEYQRWKELRLMEKAGQITELERQRAFIIFPSVTLKGRKKPDAKYLSDFSYFRLGYLVVEDVKSEATRSLPVYRLKIHGMKHLYNIEVIEI